MIVFVSTRKTTNLARFCQPSANPDVIIVQMEPFYLIEFATLQQFTIFIYGMFLSKEGSWFLHNLELLLTALFPVLYPD